MSDLRARLTDALRSRDEWLFTPEAAVEVLLSLPGIAIVDTENVLPVAEAIWSKDRCGIHSCPRAAWGWASLDTRREELYRRMARAALLAAANATESVSKVQEVGKGGGQCLLARQESNLQPPD